MTMQRMTASDWALLIGLSLLWGGSFFFVELLVVALPALTIVWLRVTLAALVLGVFLRATGGAFPTGWRVWRALVVMGLLNNLIPFTLFVLAQGQISSALASILNATTPLFTLLVAHHFTTDERLSGGKVLGLALGFGGVVVMVGSAALAEANATVAAEVACLLAALSYGFATVWGRKFRQFGVSPVTTAFGMLTCSAILLLPVVAWHDRPWALPAPAPKVMAAMAGLAVLSTALAYLIYFRLLARAGAVNLALVTFLIPASAIGLGVIVLGEVLELRHLAGLALIAAGLVAIDGRVQARLLQRSRV